MNPRRAASGGPVIVAASPDRVGAHRKPGRGSLVHNGLHGVGPASATLSRSRAEPVRDGRGGRMIRS
ncbi:Uncharacterised protein [Amycolatopsis camponoti]|uniref:Uncharacterized protein n=1 Tax=Amycolatopsis camponoti TaxID=2606593 RepID=A0A6I8LMQ5_9PSEU|nr:Uncharacterised protein [Amycolatopsis camponoti]